MGIGQIFYNPKSNCSKNPQTETSALEQKTNIMEYKVGDRFIENCSKLEIEVVGFDDFVSAVNLREAAPNGEPYFYRMDYGYMAFLIESGRWAPVPKEPEHLETHQEALERLNLKVGDKVKVLRKAKSFERDWKASWVKSMDDYIGKTLKVIDFSCNSGVRLDGNYNFPAFVLEKVENEKPLPTTEERIAALEAKVDAVHTQLEKLVDALIKADMPKPEHKNPEFKVGDWVIGKDSLNHPCDAKTIEKIDGDVIHYVERFSNLASRLRHATPKEIEIGRANEMRNQKNVEGEALYLE